MFCYNSYKSESETKSVFFIIILGLYFIKEILKIYT